MVEEGYDHPTNHTGTEKATSGWGTTLLSYVYISALNLLTITTVTTTASAFSAHFSHF